MMLTLGEMQQAMRAVGCLNNRDDIVPTGIQTDSRLLQKGELFFCLVGEQFDGHTFVESAIENGACAIVAERPIFSLSEATKLPVPILIVPDTIKALGQAAFYARQQQSGKVVGITGTAGKTTVKELLTCVLQEKGKTAKNVLNLNNQIGLPLSMLRAEGDEAFWVMEAGISQSQDMDELGNILHPDIALVLNVGGGHTEGLGDKGVAYYKARLFNYLAEGGQAVLSADYPELVAEADKMTLSEKYFFSVQNETIPYFARHIEIISPTHSAYAVTLPSESFEVVAPIHGIVGAENVIAVATVASLLGCTSKEIQQGFAKATSPERRFHVFTKELWTVIDDSYNANPLSMERTLESARELAQGKPLILVLGEMLELGAQSHAAHIELGRCIGRSGAETLYWVGNAFEEVKEGLEGCSCTVYHLENLQKWTMNPAVLQQGGVIVFKGSRGNKLEEYVSAWLGM